MKEKIKVLYKDRFLLYANSLTGVFLVTASILVFIYYSKLPPLIPIFNSMPWGMKRLYAANITLLFPLVLLIVVAINALLAIFIYKKYTLLSRILSFNSFLFCFLGLLAYLQILFLIY